MGGPGFGAGLNTASRFRRLVGTKGPAAACRDVAKSFGDIEALRGVSLEVPWGVTFGLLGPNGAGKTTLLRVWLGLAKPTSGTASVLDHEIPPRAVLPRIGYMPQDLAVYLDLTVGENLALFGRLVGMEEEEIDRRAGRGPRGGGIAGGGGGPRGAPPRGGG